MKVQQRETKQTALDSHQSSLLLSIANYRLFEIKYSLYWNSVEASECKKSLQPWSSLTLLNITNRNTIHIERLCHFFLRKAQRFSEKLQSLPKFSIEFLKTLSLHVLKVWQHIFSNNKQRVCIRQTSALKCRHSVCTESESGGHVMRNTKYDLPVKLLIEAILSATSQGKNTTTYSEIAKLTNTHYRDNMLYERLDKIQAYCRSRDFPSLPAMVINSNLHKPGKTFFVSYANHYLRDMTPRQLMESNQINPEITFEDLVIKFEQARVRSRSDWNELINNEDFTDC